MFLPTFFFSLEKSFNLAVFFFPFKENTSLGTRRGNDSKVDVSVAL